ncbi:MAG TPA: EAL domain-containing protein [Acidimicrobiales bacterium]|jgi:diguanylate cyclase (GGDEF)-like protein/PAS domain S-box-containing protein
MVRHPPLARAAKGVAAFLVLLTVVHLSPVPSGRVDRVVSDLAWVASAAVAVLWSLDDRRPSTRRRRRSVTDAAFVVVPVAWLVSSTIWALYDLILDERVPVPSMADPIYVLALLAAIVGAAWRLRGLVNGVTAVRTVLDGLLLGGSICWMASVTLVSVDGQASIVWLYPVLGAVGASLCLVVAFRLPEPNQLPWILRTAALYVLAAADAVWAFHDSPGGFVGGQLIDIAWVAGYLLLGLGALAAREVPVGGAGRPSPPRWELLVPYPTVVLAFVVAGLRMSEIEGWEIGAISALALLLVARQLLSLYEYTRLTRTLEVRVAERTNELHRRESGLRTILQRISDVIAVVGPDGRLGYLSSSVQEVLGRDPEALVGVALLDEVHPTDRDRVAEALRRAPGASRLTGVDFRLRRADGTWCPIEAKLTPVQVDESDGSLLATLRDVTERRAFEAKLLQQAYHDSLTGLANRGRLAEELDAALSRGASPSLVLLDLDEFKAINDTAGHQLGDEVLVAVANRLRACTRPNDLVARLGGDEFAVLIPHDPGGSSAERLAGRILAGLETALPVRGRAVRCGGSIGVAALREGGLAADLIRDADVAMYAAKRRGRGRMELFTADMHQSVIRRRAIEERLRASVQDGSLVLHYQPIVELGTGAAVGFEALVRIPDGSGGLIPPVEFISMAEDTNLIAPLGARVLAQACADAASWQAHRPDGPPIGVSVNLSTRQLQDAALCVAVEAALRSGLEPGLLTLEITEGALADDADTEATLHRLRSMGVRLSVDDFGAGYSSLGRLRSLPVDELKIDRSFLDPLRTDPDDAVVEAVLALGERLGLVVVAEGIETAAQVERLVGLGCRFAQGFYFAQPGPTEQVASWVTENLMVSDSSTSATAH